MPWKSYLTDYSKPITSPQPLLVYQVGDLQDAFRQMASGKSSGKIIVNLNPSDEVPIRQIYPIISEYDRC